MARFKLAPVALALLTYGSQGFAQQKNEQELPEVKVRATQIGDSAVGPDTGYGARRSLSGTKTDTPLREIPQTVEIVTRDWLDMQQSQSVPQALRYTGLISEPRGNMTKLEYLYSRGFQVDQYLDGLRLLGGSWGISQIEPYQLERIEVLKGPASILYGQASPGGVVNLVSKRPQAETYRDLQLQVGTFNRLQIAFDAAGALDSDGKLLYRFNGLGRAADTQADFSKEERILIAPSLTWKGKDTTLTAQFSYQTDPEGGFYNWVPAYGTVLPNPGGTVPRSFNAGEPNFDKFKRTQYSLGYLLEHRVNDNWTLRQNLRWNKVDTMFDNVFANVISANRLTYSRYTWHDAEELNAITVDNQAQATFRTGPAAHTVLAGLDYQEKKYDQLLGSNFSGPPTGAPPISIFNPAYGLNIPVPEFSSDTFQKQAQTGLYLQDQIKLDRWVFLLGARQDSAKQATTNQFAGTKTSQKDSATTGRIGAVYLFDNGLAPYVSQSDSFQPTTGTDFFRNAFVPTTGQQSEVGVKYQARDGGSHLTLSVFDLTQQNVLTMDPTPGRSTFQVQTGEINSRGVELSGALLQYGGWNVVGSYATMDLVVTKSNTTNLGKRPTGLPGNKASLWADYTFQGPTIPGLTVGAGVRYIGATAGDSVNSYMVPAYTLFDGAIQYNLEKMDPTLKGYRVSLNASNLTDKTFVSYCGNVNACSYGIGRNVMATLRRQW